MEKLLDTIANFNLIEWLSSPLEDKPKRMPRRSAKRRSWSLKNALLSLLGLDSWTFYVPEASGWTGAQIEALLKKHGVKIKGRGIALGDIFFSVNLDQAEWAEYVMLRAGVPINYGLFSHRNERLGR